jgi:mono/diheme cytochrome c family protein
MRIIGIVARAFSATALTTMVVGQQSPSAVFTAAQASAGRAAYDASCATCHMPDLAGRNEAPPLAGGTFMNTWRNRTTRDLFDLMAATMPPNATSLSTDQYLAIASYILQSNGAVAGTQPLTTATAAPIGSIARGAAAGAVGQPSGAGRGTGRQGAGVAAPTPGGETPAGMRGATTLNGPTGLTVPGEVKNYTPVTD